ncbi:MAG: GNAT family N-acetyltransferase, partial [Merismopedia sp. SIO2A8]|nr:GNAT family N-acetyltransferase [Merismopedia sp. SIO2A8]
QQLKATGTALVFLAGYPSYYSRYGFVPAGCRGFEATYPMPPKYEDAWMVQALQLNVIGQVQGKVQCADALDDPKFWRE